MAVQLLTSAIAVELMREERVVAPYEMRSVPVSYTHLDVYKRQAQGVAAGQNQRKGKTLIATSRLRRESRARYTSPMPPEPSTT